MLIDQALFVYLVIVIFFIFFLIKVCLRTVSAIILALLIGWVILNIIKPPSKLNDFNGNESSIALYAVIEIVTPIILLIYVIVAACSDRKPEMLIKVV